jgi:hypothetical protein
MRLIKAVQVVFLHQMASTRSASRHEPHDFSRDSEDKEEDMKFLVSLLFFLRLVGSISTRKLFVCLKSHG